MDNGEENYANIKRPKKKKQKTKTKKIQTIASNYRPITCLPMM